MKYHSFMLIFFMFSFLEIQTKPKKIVTIICSATKSKVQHRFVLPIVAATEYVISLYALIPILIASLGNIHFCSPAEPEITVAKLEKD